MPSVRDNRADMFSGIVEKTALVKAFDGRALDLDKVFDVEIGESVAVNGVCLTVTAVDGDRMRFELSEETARRTALSDLESGAKVNLERAVPATGRFGGHLVQGHVDGIAYLLEIDRLKDSVEMLVEPPPGLDRYIVQKGSVALDGVSLTVARVEGGRFTLSVIPHTLDSTNLGSKKPGDPVNIEVDLIAKYVEKLAASAHAAETGSTATESAAGLPEVDFQPPRY